MLWSWVSGVGRTSGAAVLLGLGAIIGAVIGTAETIEDLQAGAGILILIVGAWVGLAIWFWGTLATVDMALLGDERQENAYARLTEKGAKRPRVRARRIGNLSTPELVAIAALVGGVGVFFAAFLAARAFLPMT